MKSIYGIELTDWSASLSGSSSGSSSGVILQDTGIFDHGHLHLYSENSIPLLIDGTNVKDMKIHMIGTETSTKGIYMGYNNKINNQYVSRSSIESYPDGKMNEVNNVFNNLVIKVGSAEICLITF